MCRQFLPYVVLASVLIGHPASGADPASKADARYPYRTDFANASLPWYQHKAGEFPPSHSDHRVSGELIEADFIHRTGRFRETKTGALVDFTLPPFAVLNYLNAPADLRDIPLGTNLLFFLYQDDTGAFTKAATALDDFTILASHRLTYRLDEARLEAGKLLVAKRSVPKNQPDLGKSELEVNRETRVWKGDQQIQLSDLGVGDSLLVNLTGRTATDRGRCTDIWVGEETHQRATAAQRARNAEFIKVRGLPAWIDRVEGRRVTATLLSSNDALTRKELLELLETEFAASKAVHLAVANDELRSYNPPVDKMRGGLVEIQKTPSEGYGNSGLKLVLQPNNLLEGFRKGRVIRIFPEKWPVEDMPWGETLSMYRLHPSAFTHENFAREVPAQFPFRTDYGNTDLPWFQLQTGVVPPPYSAHEVTGELVSVDAANRAGQFRADRTGELVDFTLTAEGATIVRTARPKAGAPLKRIESIASVLYRDAEADLAEVLSGTRCRFHLYQDKHGAFTRASLIMDEYSWMALNHVTYRVEALSLDQGTLRVAMEIPPTIDYQGAPAPVPPLGRTFLHVDASTRVWKGGGQVKLVDLKIGDALLLNLAGEESTVPARCIDLWIGAETHQLVTEQQRRKHADRHLAGKRAAR